MQNAGLFCHRNTANNYTINNYFQVNTTNRASIIRKKIDTCYDMQKK